MKNEQRIKQTLKASTEYVKKRGYYTGQLDVAFIEGVEWADENPNLTWEDMMLIHRCIKDAMNYHLYKMMEGVEGQKVVYQEVLKRYREMKLKEK